MYIGIPQAIWLFLFITSVLLGAIKYGEQKKPGTWGLTEIFAPFISLGILYWGGFFS